MRLLDAAFQQAVSNDVMDSTGAYAKAYELLFAMIAIDPNTGQPIISENDSASIVDEAAFLSSFDLTYTQKFESGYEPVSGVDKGAWIFLRGVSEVNWRPDDNPDNTANTVYSKLVREYTKEQYETRFGMPLSEENLQDASDAIAYSILDDVINQNAGLIPTIDTIALQDASAAVVGVSEVSAAPIFDQGQVAGWAGNPFLVPVGHDTSYRNNILHENNPENTDTYDVLSVIDSTMEAAANAGFYDSFVTLFTGVLPEVVGAVPGALLTLGQVLVDSQIYLRTSYDSAFQSEIPFYSFIFDVLSTNIILGTKNDDEGLKAILTTNFSEIVHGGSGNDEIIGSAGQDLLDGGVGIDTVDYRAFNKSIIVRVINKVDASEEYTGYVQELSATPQFRDDLFNFEKIVGSNSKDNFSVGVMKNLMLDAAIGDGDKLLFDNSVDAPIIDVINGVADQINFENFEEFLGNNQDNVFIDAAGEHIYDGRDAIDTVSYAEQDALQLSNGLSGIRIEADLEKGTVERSLVNGGEIETDTITNIERIIGGSGDDIFKGKEGLSGQGFAGNGETTERGDIIDFSDYAALSGGVSITFGGTGSDSDGGSYTALSGIEQAIGTVSLDILTGDGNTNWLLGNDGIDVLRGEAGNDHIVGGKGSDFLYGGANNDTYYFSLNPQQSLWYQNGFDVIDDASGTNDTAYLLGGYTFNPDDFTSSETEFHINGVLRTEDLSDLEWVEYSDGAKFSVDRLILDEGDATAGTVDNNILDGDSSSNSLTASAGIIQVNGNGGDDWLYGVSSSTLTLDGGAGSDYLFGATGNTLDGGSGNDFLDGGLNSDIIYEASSGIDVIRDIGANGNLNVSGFTLWRADNGSLVVDKSGAQTAEQVIASDNKIIILNHFNGSPLETINGIDVSTRSFKQLGTSIDDMLLGGAEDDNFSASKGHDVYDAGLGANEFNFDVNDTGSTLIKTSADGFVDTLKFNNLLQNEVSVIRDASIGLDNLLFSYGQSFAVVEDALLDSTNAAHINVTFSDTGSLSFASLDLTTRGSNENDFIEGDVVGFSVDDIIFGRAGDDVIESGEGEDTIYAGSGDDIVETGIGSDTVYDEAGDDIYTLGKGDHIYLGSGSDRIEYGGEAASSGDTLETFVVHLPSFVTSSDIVLSRDSEEPSFIKLAYAGNEIAIQSAFTPILEFEGGVQYDINEFTLTTEGTSSHDTIVDFLYLDQNRSQNDIIYGYEGDDDINVFYGGNDIVYGGSGDDVIGQAEPGYTITGSVIFYGDEGNDVLTTLTLSGELYGGDGDDALISSNVTSNTMDGGDGNDWISAGDGGTDDIFGGAGNDTILGLLGGVKTIDGGDGNDLIILDSDGDDIIDGGGGLDIVSFEGAFGVSTSQIDLSAQTATVNGTSYSYSNIEGAIGSYGDDNIVGNATNNILDGGTGFGGPFVGNDTLQGGAGDDTYVFGTPFEVRVPPHQQGSGTPPAPVVGDDIVDDSSGSSDSIEFTDFFELSDLTFNQIGNNLVISFTDGSVTILNQFNGNEVENIILADGSKLDLSDYNNWTLGTDNAETLNGVLAGETLYGLDGDDILNAYAGGSKLHGGFGIDTLNGSAGNDILNGGAGNDLIAGGDGDDIYVFAPGDGIDEISDTSGFDILSVGGAITLKDLTFSQIGNDLQIDIASGVTIKDFYAGNSDLLLEEIHFDDGSTFDLTSLINTDPIAMDDVVTGSQDAVLSGNVLSDNGYGQDSDLDGDIVSVLENTYVTDHGFVSISSNGDFEYVPSLGFFGQDTFTYTLDDGRGGSDTATVTVDVLASSIESPDAINIASTGFNAYSGNQDAGGVASLIYSATGAALEGNAWKKIVVPMEYTVTSDTYITFEYKSTIEGEIQGFGLDTDDDYTTGPSPFKLFGTQSGGSTFIDTYEYTGAGDWQYFSINVGAHQTGAVDFLTFINDHDSAPQDGNSYFRNVVLYERDAGTINVAPQAIADEFEGAINTAIIGNLFADNFHGLDFDVDNDALNAVAETITTTNGSVTISANGDFTYTPDTGFSGTDSFVYTLEDGNGGSDTVTATLFVGTTDADETFTTSSAYEFYNGGAGVDLVDYSTSATRVKLNLGAGIGWDGDANDDTYVHVENVIGTDIAGDRDFIYGSEADNYIWGLAGNDQLEGMDGADTIDGGAGSDYSNYTRSDAGVTVNLKTNIHTGGHAEGDDLISIENIIGSDYADHITGSDGGNKLYAESGDDVIYGGAGSDTMYGGSGADTFVFGATDSIGYIDTIDDFSTAQGDKLDLSDLISTYDPVTDAITDFIQITDSGNNSIVSVDIDGGADNFVQVATLNDITGLTDEDALETSGNLITV